MNRMIQFRSAALMISIGVVTLVSADHRISVGPRTGYYKVEQLNTSDAANDYAVYGTRYTEFIQGFSLGYGYYFDIADIFRIDIGIDNSLDFRFGSFDNSSYGRSGKDLFVEPGISFLFTALNPLTVRVRAGYSYHYTKYTYEGSEAGGSPFSLHQKRWGVVISPGLFVHNDLGYLGPVMVNRFQNGNYYYSADDFATDTIENAARMLDWGFEGGVTGKRVSHTASIIFSKENYAARGKKNWVVWNKIKPEILFAYQLGIHLRGPRSGE